MYDNAHFVRLEALVGVTYGVLLIRSGPQHFPLCHVEQRQGQLDLLSLRLLGVAVGGPLPCRSLLGEAVGTLRCCPGFLLLLTCIYEATMPDKMVCFDCPECQGETVLWHAVDFVRTGLG